MLLQKNNNKKTITNELFALNKIVQNYQVGLVKKCKTRLLLHVLCTTKYYASTRNNSILLAMDSVIKIVYFLFTIIDIQTYFLSRDFCQLQYGTPKLVRQNKTKQPLGRTRKGNRHNHKRSRNSQQRQTNNTRNTANAQQNSRITQTVEAATGTVRNVTDTVKNVTDTVKAISDTADSLHTTVQNVSTMFSQKVEDIKETIDSTEPVDLQPILDSLQKLEQTETPAETDTNINTTNRPNYTLRFFRDTWPMSTFRHWDTTRPSNILLFGDRQSTPLDNSRNTKTQSHYIWTTGTKTTLMMEHPWWSTMTPASMTQTVHMLCTPITLYNTLQP